MRERYICETCKHFLPPKDDHDLAYGSCDIDNTVVHHTDLCDNWSE